MLYGSNVASTPGQKVMRLYNTPSEGVPSAYPGGGQTVPAGQVGLVSFKPGIPAVLSGSLDAQIGAFFAKAPAGSLLTAWHEGNLPHNNLVASQVLAMHLRLHSIARNANPRIQYGAVLGTYRVYTSGQNLVPWVPSGLDFIGLDGYQSPLNETPHTIFGIAARQLVPSIISASKLMIVETNTNLKGPNTDNGPWLQATVAWAGYAAKAFGVPALQGYMWYGGSGYPEPSAATLAALAKEV